MSAGVPSGPRNERRVVVRRIIPAPPDAVFTAWTEPSRLLEWWGPRGVTLAAAEIDLRAGGRYRLANKFEDGSILWITGVFELVDRPHQIAYTCAHEPLGAETEHTRVTVAFQARDGGTEVTVTHEGFRSTRSRQDHKSGWLQCLQGLNRTFTS
jgi:uncharacterized protein YndB with AHSA1/START domain